MRPWWATAARQTSGGVPVFDAASFSTASFSTQSWRIPTIAIARAEPIVQSGMRSGAVQLNDRYGVEQYAIRSVGPYGMRQANTQRSSR